MEVRVITRDPARAAHPRDLPVQIVTGFFDAMTAVRPYRPALSHAEALDNLRQGAGTQFDPKVVAAFLALQS